MKPSLCAISQVACSVDASLDNMTVQTCGLHRVSGGALESRSGASLGEVIAHSCTFMVLQAYLHVAPFVAGFEVYRAALVDHLIDR